MHRALNAVHTRCGCVQVYDQQKQLAAVTAELQASQEQAERQQKELDRANRLAQRPRLFPLYKQQGPSMSMPERPVAHLHVQQLDAIVQL
jgi:hypothetical protein